MTNRHAIYNLMQIILNVIFLLRWNVTIQATDHKSIIFILLGQANRKIAVQYKTEQQENSLGGIAFADRQLARSCLGRQLLSGHVQQTGDRKQVPHN